MCISMSDVSTLFELLASDTRRRLLVALCDVESVQVPEGLLARGQARAPAGPSWSPTDDAETDPQELRLYHNHLPKLAAEDVIEWNREADVVSRGPAFEEIEPLVRLLAANPQVLPDEFF